MCENTFAKKVYIEKLIIPEGVTFGMVSFAEPRVLSNTEIYFERAREYEEKDGYVIIGNENDSGRIEVKAAYYEDEWKYVNGVPTPK